MDTFTNDRTPTGIAGFDVILGGGLPANRLFLVEGNPGTGKTTLALQFLQEGIKRGEKALYVTLSETKAELMQVASSHGWSLDGLSLYELESLSERLQPDEQYTFFHPAEIELSETTKTICAEVERLKPSRVVFDSLSEMRLLARDPLRYRREVLALKQFFAGRKCTVLLLDDRTSLDTDLQLQSICHGVVLLENLVTDYGTTPRRVRIVKMRGVQFQEGFHDYEIRRGGIVIYPRLIAAKQRPNTTKIKSKPLESGIKELDSLVGGGLDFGTSTLVMGPAGSGKSSTACQYILQSLQHKDPVTYYLFEEGRSSFLKRTAGQGMDFEPYINSGLLNAHQIDPSTLTPGEFAARVQYEVEHRKIKTLVIDSLNGYLNAMPSERYLLIQMHELLTYLNDHGILTLIVLTQHGFLGSSMKDVVDVSYLADTVILLRYFEASGAVKKAVSVIKKRAGHHEDKIREFKISKTGIQIGTPLENFHGVLTGVPIYKELEVKAPAKNAEDN